MKWNIPTPAVFTRMLALAAALIFSVSAQAVPITFSFAQDYDENLASVFLTESGVNLTADGFSTSGLSLADPDGLCFAGWGDQFAYCKNPIDFLELTFSETVQILSYEVGYFTPADPASGAQGASDVELDFAQGANTSSESNFVVDVVTDFNNQFVVNAGEALTVSASNFIDDFGSVQIREITVELVRNDVPAPATLALIGLGLLGLGYSRKRKLHCG